MTNTLPRPRHRGTTGPAALLAGALLLTALPVIADAPPAGPAPAILQVLPLRDAGGLPEAGGKAPLNAQLTQGLSKYLADTSTGRVLIVDAQMDAVPGRTQTGQGRRGRGGGKPQFTLEGELSHVQAGPYFCVLRLFEAVTSGGSPARRLRHQWAGLAQTYLDLTANLRHDDRVDPEGLVGSLAKSVLADITASPSSDQAKQFAAFVATASSFKRVTAKVIPEAASPVPTPPLQSGDRYRLKVSSQDRGSVYLVALDSGGQPSGLFLPEGGQEIEVDADRPALVPAESPLQTGFVTTPTDRKIVVLVRRSRKGAAQAAPMAGRLRLARMGMESPPNPADTPPPGASAAVQILDSAPAASSPPAPDDPGIANLLQMAASDPAGTWLAQTVTVRIVPKKNTGTER